MKNYADDVRKVLDENFDKFSNLADYIWEHPEPGLIEYESSKKLMEFLKDEGFEIENPISGMETAFKATYGNSGPVIGFSVEYDALPGLSQKRGSATKEELVPGGAGHGCGHNILGVGALGGAVVLKDLIENEKLDASVVVVGAPSEERDGAKTFIGRDGYYEGIDIMLTWHPESKNAIWNGGSLANIIVTYNFKGTTSHAAAAPQLGRSALDACELMNVGVNYLREHVVDSARIHYAYLDVGGNAPNVVQSHATLYYFIRAAKIDDALNIYERINNIAKGAALMAGVEVEINLKGALADFSPNLYLSGVLYDSIKEFGTPKFDEDDLKLAKELYETLDDNTKKAAVENMTYLYGDELAKEQIANHIATELAPFDGKYGKMEVISSDVGELSHYVPTAQMFLAASPVGTPLHTWQMCSSAGGSIGKKTLYSAIGSLATCGLKAALEPEVIEKAHEEFDSVIGKYEAPIPEDLKIRDPNIES
ncbi:amidohydrolase [Peptoniphilus sp.]|jgi:aminobenzoyl-glutamate utilization protein B|uniref:amidohydrolase n=1 Tax=Peptoniphilus sp. TaxID=1971214 RepID=UPI003D8D6E15